MVHLFRFFTISTPNQWRERCSCGCFSHDLGTDMPDSQHNISSPLRERSFLVIAILYYIEHHLWHRLGLNISSSEPMTALNQLKLHGSPSAQRAIALSRKRRKVEEHLVACSISGDYANTCIEIEPAHHSVCNWQTVCTYWWSTTSPFLLGDANLLHFGCRVRFVAVISTAFHDGSQVVSQILVGRTSHKVPPVIDPEDAQIHAQDKGVRFALDRRTPPQSHQEC
jgi:hypothetical protein